jgi:hypothetical protein
MAIPLNLNFKLNAQTPLDDRNVVSNISSRDNLVTENRVYPGLLVYVISEDKYYYYGGSSWIGLTLGGSNSLKFESLVLSTNANLAINTKYGVNTTFGSTFELNLPTTNLNLGDCIEIIDMGNLFDLNPVTIKSSIHNIESVPGNLGLVCNVKGAHFLLVWTGVNRGWGISVLDQNFSNAGIIDNKYVIPLLYLRITGTEELFDSPDSNNYVIPWNKIEWYNPEYTNINGVIDPSKIITYNQSNKNIYFSQQGIYNVDLRFSSFNLIDSNDFLRARLRSSTSPITNGLSSNAPNPPSTTLPDPPSGPNVLAAFAQGPIGTSFNGEAMQAGFTTFRIDAGNYVVADFLHFGAFNPNTSLNRGFPVFNNTFGNQPFMFISKII